MDENMDWLGEDDDLQVYNLNEYADYMNEDKPTYDGEDDEDFTETRSQEAEEATNESLR